MFDTWLLPRETYRLFILASFISVLTACGGGGGGGDDDSSNEDSSSNVTTGTWVFGIARPLDIPVKRADGEAGLFVSEWFVDDFNADGFKDVMTNGPARNSAFLPISIPMTVLLGDGQGGFREGATEIFGATVPSQVHTREIRDNADFDGDGKNDALFVGHGYDEPPFPGEPLQLILSNNGSWIDASARLNSVASFYHTSVVFDANNDGDSDILLFDLGIRTRRLLLGDGNGNFIDAPTGMIPEAVFVGASGATSEGVDLDLDGCDDLIMAGETTFSDDTISWSTCGNPANWFSSLAGSTVIPPVPNAEFTLDVETVMLPDSSLPYLLLSRTSPSYQDWYIQVMKQDTPRQFTDVTAQWFPEQPALGDDRNIASDHWKTRIVPADFDNDGYIDLILQSDGRDEEISTIYRNTGSYFQHIIPEPNGQRLNYILIPIDFDNDGDLDLLQRYTEFGFTDVNGEFVNLVYWSLIENTTN